MNDRIYNLSLLADQYAHSICDGNEHADWYQTRDQKFAELIVRECILTIQLKMPRDGSTPENIRSREHVQDIKQHFGVE